MPDYNSHQLDYCVREVTQLFRTVDQRTVRKIQATFLEQKKMASTYIASAISAILVLHFCLALDHLIMVAIILMLAIFCWKKYCSLCKCPNCKVSLLSGSHIWRMNARRFATSSCPRCQIQLIAIDNHERLTDAQVRKLEHQKWSKAN